ncbi:HXXXD-type acyl-transferase family protein [Abeliophyllum distichum]|uniref:HXXXD-type acyl-transferase family protein n=1 Tax=Abeliophyllum distichum TaxID=126358 RepID=A0ABD1R7R8_9LAMI
MKCEIEVICTEIIKPCSSTPEFLRKYQLSFLDQIAPPVFMPLVYFYPANSKITNLERSNQLKKSLSGILTRFYPLAGRVVDNLYVDCNDEGTPCVQAKANCKLSEVISDPIPGQLNKFLPYELDDVKNLCSAVQITVFSCGGMALGLVISHKIADALSFFLFANSWAAMAREEKEISNPIFESAAIFPPRDVAGFKPSTGIVKEDITTKIFTFSSQKISLLRDIYAAKNGENTRRPTRIEALSTYIWSRFMSSTQEKHDPDKIYTVLHAVNLRTRLDPPLSEHYFGNISRLAIAIPSMEDREKEGYGVLNKVREAIRGVNGDYLAKLREGDKHLKFVKERAAQANKGDLVTFNFTSLCRFPLYEADFGWGKPVWVGSASLTYKNLVTFMDTKSGDGIEAWIHLKKQDMLKFEADMELNAFLSSSPADKTFGFQNLQL